MTYRSIQQFYCNGVVVQHTICDNVKFGFESTEIRRKDFFQWIYCHDFIPVFQVGWIYEMLRSVIWKKQMIFWGFQCNYAKRLPGRWAGSLVLYMYIYIYIYILMNVCMLSGWWFGTLFICPYIGNNDPNWLILFRGVETTNELCCIMLCCVVLCYVVSCCVMLCCVVVCYAMQCNLMSCHAM